MTTYVVPKRNDFGALTEGEKYEVTKEEGVWVILDDDGNKRFFYDKPDVGWIIIEEHPEDVNACDDTPPTWGEMADAEKGALLLAHHEGKMIQVLREAGDWADLYFAGIGIIPTDVYRIKPEPVVGEVAIYGKTIFENYWGFGAAASPSDTHTLTLPTLDDKLVTGEFTNEDGMKVVIEEKQK